LSGVNRWSSVSGACIAGFAALTQSVARVKQSVTRDVSRLRKNPGLRFAPSGLRLAAERALSGTLRLIHVIASAAKRSMARQVERWIASLRAPGLRSPCWLHLISARSNPLELMDRISVQNC
jgi:hypothetical protein